MNVLIEDDAVEDEDPQVAAGSDRDYFRWK
jgi:hypothetical protein